MQQFLFSKLKGQLGHILHGFACLEAFLWLKVNYYYFASHRRTCINSAFFRIFFPQGASGPISLLEWLVELQWDFVRILAQLVYTNSDTGSITLFFSCWLWFSTTVKVDFGNQWLGTITDFSLSQTFPKATPGLGGSEQVGARVSNSTASLIIPPWIYFDASPTSCSFPVRQTSVTKVLVSIEAKDLAPSMADECRKPV